MSDMPKPLTRSLHIVIIARHYPPEISGGARRPFLLARGLRDAGHHVCVVSPQSDLQHEDDVHVPHPAMSNNVEDAEGPAAEKSVIRAWLRLWLLWPDPDIRWARRVSATLKASAKPDVVLTTSPPESVHYIGYSLRQSKSVWLAELRDGWVENPLRESLRRSALRRFIESKLARVWLKKADGIIAVSETILEEGQRLAPKVPAVFIGHFADSVVTPKKFPGEGPHFLHTGRFSLSHPDRNLHVALNAFSQAVGYFSDTARLHLVGKLTAAEKDQIAQHPCAPQIIVHGQMPMDRARALQAGADILVLSQHEGSTSIPGKYAEYLASGRPIAVVGDGPWRENIQNGPVAPLEQFTPELVQILSQQSASLTHLNMSYTTATQAYLMLFNRLLPKV